MALDRASEGRRALVIVPTYNERSSVIELARRLFDAAGDSVDLLVVDDGSPDGTGDVVRSIAQGAHAVHLVERPVKAGLGSAYVEGFRWGLARGYPALVEMDADLSHDPADVPRLLAALDRAELVLGSRYVEGGSIHNWGRIRRLLSAAGNRYARMWLRLGIKDVTSGFRAYRAGWLAAQDLDSLRSDGYVFQIEMARRAVRSGGRVAEVPIRFVERAAGESKISRRIVLEAIVRVTLWGLADLVRRGGSRSGKDPAGR